LQPVVRDDRGGGFELISTYINRPSHDARIAVELGTDRRVSVEAGVDAGRVGLQAKIAAGFIHEQRRVRDVTDPVCGAGRRATVVQDAVGIVIHFGSRAEIDNAIVQCADLLEFSCRPAAGALSRVAGERAVVQRASVSTTAAGI